MFIGAEPIDLSLTLIESAQCFLWRKAGDWFVGVPGGNAVWLRRTDAGVEAEGEAGIGAIRRYLDLDRDYATVAAEFAHIPAAACAMARYPGLRVLNQRAWDALVCFILSANNNVPRIRRLVDAVCASLGPARETPFGVLHGIPDPRRLADAKESELRALGMGYRAPYLIETARMVADGFPLEALAGMPFEDALRALTRLPGVGDKVANCVLLFGCGHSAAFPVDVWVARLLGQWFGLENMPRQRMSARARELLGPHAGIMQQYLFHAARTGGVSAGPEPGEELPCAKT